MEKMIIYIDMDGVLVDFNSAFKKVDPVILRKYKNKKDEIPSLFSLMDPMPGAIEAFKKLSAIHDVYILSTAPWKNPSAWTDKALWVKKYLGKYAKKRLIITHNKHLNKGDILIDDRKKNGSERFSGKLILFGSTEFPDWKSVRRYFNL